MRHVDFLIIGSGFGGSITAMILRRLGRSVAVIERGRHPRFAIGESSTPLANLLLEEVARKYDLPDLAAFSKWGTWQAAHPEIGCGLKRGFTFYKHEWNRPFDFADRTQQLLVAASPHDRIADTHWYRPEFDAHMARQAAGLGAEIFEEAAFDLDESRNLWRIAGRSGRGEFAFESPFLIDAAGPRGCLAKHFKMGEASEGFVANGFPRTEALYAHFRGVSRLDPQDAGLPYPPDDAALHHIFNSGWIWVLRFNNGITSAGVVAEQGLSLAEGEIAWHRLLARLPTVQAQFKNARAVTPFFHQPLVPFRSRRAAGSNWAMLPSAAGFVDPLFSTGFVLTLLGIQRLVESFAADYEAITFQELDRVGGLVQAAYRSFPDFPAFAAISRQYFTAAIWSETLRRLGRKPPRFLLCDDAHFQPETLGDYDLAGLTDHSRRNWHPAVASDLIANAGKIPATETEIQKMLARCGFDG